MSWSRTGLVCVCGGGGQEQREQKEKEGERQADSRLSTESLQA